LFEELQALGIAFVSLAEGIDINEYQERQSIRFRGIPVPQRRRGPHL
jgi:hypothetical protein